MNYNPRGLSLSALFGILLGLLCNAVTQMFNQPLQAQTGVPMTIDQFLFAAAAIERGIEIFKRAVLERFLGGDAHATARGVIAFILSMIAGLIVAFVLNLNMFASLGAAYALAGTALTGLIVGGGSNFVHRAWDLLGQLATLLDDRIEARLTHG
jgi:hypothetical protein